MKSIVFDLEHTLVDNIRGGNPAPDAEEILKRSGRDFDKVYLWTSCLMKETLPLLEGLKFRYYFDGILAGDSNGLGLPNIVLIGNGNNPIKTFLLSSSAKNLALLGNPGDYVLIEDTLPFGKSYAIPESRVVEIIPLGYSTETGRLISDLSKGYERALKKFP